MISIQLVSEIRGVLTVAGDPEKAIREQIYMKSALSLHGVWLPEMRRITKRLLKEHPLADRDQRERTIRGLWGKVTYRERWCTAPEITGHHDTHDWQNLGALELYRRLATTEVRWDVVDGIASPLVENVVTTAPGMRVMVWGWTTGDDLWSHHISVIRQLQRRTSTNPELLGHAIDSNLEGSRYGSEFFIRKAIGRALRQHARVDPD